MHSSRAREVWMRYTAEVKKALVPAAEPGIASVAALIGDSARAAMLCALMDGGELTASDLARRGAVAPNAASAHLAKLVAGGLLAVRASGRQRLFRLASAPVGHAIEALSAIAPPPRIVGLSQSRISEELREARTCYDHLAGRLGVGVTEALAKRGVLIARADDYALSRKGAVVLAELGVDLDGARASRRSFAHRCLDWSERRSHVAGALGAAICDAFLGRRLVERRKGNRSLRITPAGMEWMKTWSR
jgi:DNA-binding transcriptional ArsR family regulator